MVRRLSKFSAVGVVGAGVQLLALALFLRLHLNYLLATAAAVETAILHNYQWHARWTWRGRPGRFWRFQVSNGLVSLTSNLILMRLLTGAVGIPPIPSNLIAIAATSLANFWLGDRWVFDAASRHLRPGALDHPGRPSPMRHTASSQRAELEIDVIIDPADHRHPVIQQQVSRATVAIEGKTHASRVDDGSSAGLPDIRHVNVPVDHDARAEPRVSRLKFGIARLRPGRTVGIGRTRVDESDLFQSMRQR